MKENIKVNIKNTKNIIAKTDVKRYRRLEVNRYLPIINMILKYVKKDAKLLDVGIREGAFLNILKKQGFTNLSGVDIYEEGVKAANEQGFKCQIADAEDFDLNETFDVVTVSHVLEHCPNPIKVLNCIYNHLKLKGILYVEVPKQKKEPVPTVHAHYYCFNSMNDLLSFFDLSQWEIIEKREVPSKKNPKRGNLKLIVRRK